MSFSWFLFFTVETRQCVFYFLQVSLIRPYKKILIPLVPHTLNSLIPPRVISSVSLASFVPHSLAHYINDAPFFSLRQFRMYVLILRKRKAQTEVAKRAAWAVGVTKRNPAVHSIAVPATATAHAVRARCRSCRIGL